MSFMKTATTSQHHLDGTNRSSSGSRTGRIYGSMITSGFGAFEFSWPQISLCAMLAGVIVFRHCGSGPRHRAAADQLHRLVTTRPPAAQPEAQQALVITANRSYEIIVVATLSPRGFHPLLASSAREVLEQIYA